MNDKKRLQLMYWAQDECKGNLSDKVVIMFFARECDDDLVVRNLSAEAIGIVNGICIQTALKALKRLEDRGLIKSHKQHGARSSYTLCRSI